MRLIGITGGIGAGKTEVLSFIRQHYLCKICLADEVAHIIQSPGQDCYVKMVALLGKAVSELLRGIVRRQDTAISETIPFEVVKADTGRI